MARYVSLLMMLALVLTNGAAVASAVCQHVDARAHVSARQSSDASIAAAALSEDAASAATSRKGMLADAAAAQLAGFLIPDQPVIPGPGELEPSSRSAADAAELSSIAIIPLLEPPAV